MSRSYSGILLILLTTVLTGFSTSECQGQQNITNSPASDDGNPGWGP